MSRRLANRLRTKLLPELRRYKRRLRLAWFVVSPGPLKENLRGQINSSYRRLLASNHGISVVRLEDIANWRKLDLTLRGPTTNEGQVSKLELLCIVGLVKERLDSGSNFLEIGTFDGNTALNAALNLPPGSTVITIDLPENAQPGGGVLPYDGGLITASARIKKRHLEQHNVLQLYADSTRVDFGKLAFSGAFIDGGHDYSTVYADSVNVLQHIKRPGFVLWHDYDVENEVGEVIHRLAAIHPIRWIEGTRLAFLELTEALPGSS